MTFDIVTKAFDLAQALYICKVEEVVAVQLQTWRKRQPTCGFTMNPPSDKALNAISQALSEARDAGLHEAIVLINRESDAGGKCAQRFSDCADALKAMKSTSVGLAQEKT